MEGVVESLRAAGCVFAEEEAGLLVEAATTTVDLRSLVERRVAGLPLEQVLGWAEFRGLRIEVDPGVFVPRRRTELLVTWAVALARPAAVVVDLCCGSGALAAALAGEIEGAQVYAVDIDAAAAGCAGRNLEPLGGQALEGDLYAPLPEELRGSVDLLVVCAPYVPSDAIRLMPPEARLHEPRSALDGGPDGLDVVRQVIAQAPQWLGPGGHLLVETSADQAPITEVCCAGAGMAARTVTAPELSATAVIGSVVAARQRQG